MAVSRIYKEMSDISNSIHKVIPENISAGPVNKTNIFDWNATIIGAVGTPYEGGIFKLSIKLPGNYPFLPPIVKFQTKIFHPNIHENGEICLDILKYHWSPAYTISQVLLSILSLLSDPNPNDPLNTEAAQLYKTDKETYNKVVQTFVYKFAS